MWLGMGMIMIMKYKTIFSLIISCVNDLNIQHLGAYKQMPKKKKKQVVENNSVQEQTLRNSIGDKQNSNIKNIILFLLFLFALFCYLYFSTPLFFEKSSSEPIKIYYGTSQGDIKEIGISTGGALMTDSKAFKQKYQIPYINFKIKNPLGQSECEVSAKFDNLKKEINFWGKADAQGVESFKQYEAHEYMKKPLLII
jgi:hypothetical protein